MNGLGSLNQEDLLLLGLLCLLLMNKKKDNWELLIGLGFLFYAGLRERGILPGPTGREKKDEWSENAGLVE